MDIENQNRRHFLKTTTVGAAGISILGSTLLSSFMSDKNKM